MASKRNAEANCEAPAEISTLFKITPGGGVWMLSSLEIGEIHGHTTILLNRLVHTSQQVEPARFVGSHASGWKSHDNPTQSFGAH